MAINTSPTLASVKEQFSAWRQTRTNLKTPLALKEQAVGLLVEHGISQVCKSLDVNHDMVKRWRREVLTQPLGAAAFVELPAAATPAAITPAAVAVDDRLDLTLIHQSVDGSTMSLSGQLSPEQWRQALQLLRQRP